MYLRKNFKKNGEHITKEKCNQIYFTKKQIELK